jgi:hypothetical protein
MRCFALPSISPSEMPRLWASKANPDILAKLPELYGEVGYMVWALGEIVHLHAEATAMINRLSRYGLEREVAIQISASVSTQFRRASSWR